MSTLAAVEAAPAAPPPPAPAPAPWPFAQRLLFRFVFSWLFLIIEPFPFRDIPGLRWIGWLADKLLDKPFTWTSMLAAKLMHYSGPLEVNQNGSGDRTVDWVQNLGCLLFAVIVTAIWCALDRKPRRHDRLYTFLRVYARYWLAIAVLGYGLEKLFVMQMPVPSAARLEEPFGDASPMGLLWTFLGASPAYERFTGLAELTGCLLLLSRRTALLGAVTLAGVMFNVVMFNLCYDVPVKIYSTTLFLTAIFLCVDDAPRLVAVLLGRAAPPGRPRFVPATQRARIALLAVEIVVGVGLCVPSFLYERGVVAKYGHKSAPLPLEGRWAVDKQILDARELPPLLSEGERWQTVNVARFGNSISLYAHRVDGTAVRLRGEVDDGKHTVKLNWPEEDKLPPPLTFTIGDADHVTIGDGAQKWVLGLRKLPPRTYLLMTRGFHWINEAPFNR